MLMLHRLPCGSGVQGSHALQRLLLCLVARLT
jgi:hypothetical protein